MTNNENVKDKESENFLTLIGEDEKQRVEKVKNVKSVLVIFSTRAMAYDRAALTQKIQLTYPEAKVFFMTTSGLPVGLEAPEKIDLLIDFTGPGQKHKRFLARKLRSITRVAVGRNAGFFRPYIYDQIADESLAVYPKDLSRDLLTRERWAQRQVLLLAGIPLSQKGELLKDKGKEMGSYFSAVVAQTKIHSL